METESKDTDVPSERRKVVKKFGGTSIGSKEKLIRAANIVAKSHEDKDVVVVVSAMSRENKTTGTTEKLINAAKFLVNGSDNYEQMIYMILEDYLKLSKEIFKNDKNRLQMCLEDIQGLARETNEKLKAMFVLKEVTTRSWDYIIGYGERLSAILFTHVLMSMNLNSKYYSLEDLLDPAYNTEFNIDGLLLYSEKISKIYKNAGKGVVPVFTGVFGPVPNGIIDVVGRGYTDLTAALTAVSIKAETLEIWKDVDGVFTADPNILSNAKFIRYLDPREAEELTLHGSEVVHPMAMELVSKYSINLSVKNASKAHHPGTTIAYNAPKIHTDDMLSYSDERSGYSTAVTFKKNVVLLSARPKYPTRPGILLASIIMILEKNKYTTLISSSCRYSVSIVFENIVMFKSLSNVLDEIFKIATYEIIDNVALITLIGLGLRCAIGSSTRMLNSLAKKKVNILMISQSASEISISVLIQGSKLEVALDAVHTDCILNVVKENNSLQD